MVCTEPYAAYGRRSHKMKLTQYTHACSPAREEAAAYFLVREGAVAYSLFKWRRLSRGRVERRRRALWQSLGPGNFFWTKLKHLGERAISRAGRENSETVAKQKQQPTAGPA